MMPKHPDPTRRAVLRGALGAGGTAMVASAFAPPAAAETGPAAPSLAQAERPLAPKVLVIGHRGASALRPEHTLASYAKAIADGADFVEPDLVITKDGVLVARHESNITETTDVALHPEFASRRTTRTVDGQASTGWFTIDFTLGELKTLRARERMPLIRPRNARYDGMFDIPTFEEIIDFVAAESAARGREIGLIPELKSTPFFRSAGLPTEDVFVRIIGAHRYTGTGPLEVQSFYGDSLRMVRDRIGRSHSNIRLMQLLASSSIRFPAKSGNGDATGFADMMSPKGLAEIATYADVIGPDIRSVIPLDATSHLGAPATLVHDAHAAGLLVHPYTFRPENHFLPADFRNQAGDTTRNPDGSVAEIQRYIDTGIDGFFTDDPAIGRRAVDRD
nr:glycerophosphodiester phosphodiesterase [Lichenicola cladoniae]